MSQTKTDAIFTATALLIATEQLGYRIENSDAQKRLALLLSMLDPARRGHGWWLAIIVASHELLEAAEDAERFRAQHHDEGSQTIN